MKVFKLLIGYVIILLCFLNMTQCNEDDLIISDDLSLILVCDEPVIIDDDIYNEDTSDYFVIESAIIEDDCLTIMISASGCDSNSWDFDLIASTLIGESIPLQRFVKLIFTNPEACLAYFTKEVSFDLSTIQVENENQVGVNLLDFEDRLLYSY